MTSRTNRIYVLIIGIAVITAILIPSIASAQGSIFGSVSNSGGTTPNSSAFCFIGFLDGGDNEVRIEECIGAGYDNGNWYDDFQNYLDEAAGKPYQYHYYNFDNNEGSVLNSTIPGESFWQEDIELSPVSWPTGVFWVQADLNDDDDFALIWNYTPGQVYHIYRREGSSDGSFYRIDNAGNSYTDGGIADSVYVDLTTIDSAQYDYLVVPRSGTDLGPHSGTQTFRDWPFTCGNVNNDHYVNILDILDLVDYKFRNGPIPDNAAAADTDGSGQINVLDIIDIIDYKFRGGSEPSCPLHIDIH